LESDFQGIWVSGEISGCRLAPSGHYYFCLKDQESQVKAVLFKGTARYLRCKPKDGLAVIARGNLEVYLARGEYQLIVETLEPQGAGALQLAFEELKRKLAAEGLFDQNRKRRLPRFPKRIGIVTSPGGAVIQDMLNVLRRRFPGLHLRLYPAQVQGELAVGQVCEGISWFSDNQWAEVAIVARGGGSLEDLWTFNEERVARAVAACTVPVISAIGHETDFTICDFVADLRAPTPSAAAELVICTRESLVEQFQTQERRTLQALRYRLMKAGRDLQHKGTERAVTLMHRTLARYSQRVDDAEAALVTVARRRLDFGKRRQAGLAQRLAACDVRVQSARVRGRLNLLERNLSQAIETRLQQLRHRQQSLLLHLNQISPLRVLSRGYAIVQDANGQVLRSANETVVGSELKVRLHRGSLDVAVVGGAEAATLQSS
jgi:exodeoxyribonuclease VII large subunit